MKTPEELEMERGERSQQFLAYMLSDNITNAERLGFANEIAKREKDKSKAAEEFLGPRFKGIPFSQLSPKQREQLSEITESIKKQIDFERKKYNIPEQPVPPPPEPKPPVISKTANEERIALVKAGLLTQETAERNGFKTTPVPTPQQGHWKLPTPGPVTPRCNCKTEKQKTVPFNIFVIAFLFLLTGSIVFLSMVSAKQAQKIDRLERILVTKGKL